MLHNPDIFAQNPLNQDVGRNDDMARSNDFNASWSLFLVTYGLFLFLTVALYAYGFAFDSSAGIRVAAVFTAVTLLYLPLFLVKHENRAAAVRKASLRTAGVLVFASVFFVAGELALRIIYWDGESFGNHTGPIVKRFERDFKFNQYEGPSRGPEISGATKPGALRVLVQGDSITWGQGVRSEEDLFTTRLLTAIRDSGRAAEMATLAQPGRDIDDHLEQLKQWSREIDPDVIIYQWSFNDVDVDKSSRPPWGKRFWRINPMHKFLARSSYLYYFLDYQFNRMLPSGLPKLGAYLAEHYAENSMGWAQFELVFQAWARAAKDATPRILVAIYPDMNAPINQRPTLNPHTVDIQERLVALCQRENLQVLDLFEVFSTRDNARDLIVGDYDGHPSVDAHHTIAIVLEMSLRQLWPEIFHPEERSR